MKPVVILMLTVTPILVLVYALNFLFSLYVHLFVALGLSFFTAAIAVIGLFAAYDAHIILFCRRSPGEVLVLTLGLGLAYVNIITTHQAGADLVSIGTMSMVAASIIGAYVGQQIGIRLTSVFL